MIYFDQAATSLQKPPRVGQAVLQAMGTLGNAGRGAHEPTLQASRVVYGAREKLARLFHAEDPSRIAFACNATEALNMAVQGIFAPGDHVITTAREHNSVLRPLYRMEDHRVELTVLPADTRGNIDYCDLEKNLRKNTRAVVIGHASNVTGSITDLQSVSEFTRRHGLLLVVDAAQTAGVLPIDVQEMGIDVLCFTGHKGLMGPQGTGGIYVREGVPITSMKVGGSGIHSYDRSHPSRMPELLEAGTMNVHGIAGLSAALDYLEQTGIDEIRKKESQLARQFLEGIQKIPGITVYGDPDSDQNVAVVSLNLGEEDSGRVADWLWEDYGICVRAGAHCAPLMHCALGTQKQGTVRFSFSHYNTEEEVDCAIDALRELEDIP